MDDTEAARRQAEEDHRRNAQTEKASEYTIKDAVVRDAYNAELYRQRRSNG